MASVKVPQSKARSRKGGSAIPLDETDKRALFLYHNPAKHPMAKAFKQVLAKVGDKNLSEEEVAILREAYLLTDGERVYTLRSRKLARHSRSQRWIWKLTCPI